ncbi:MAG: hypothetical protein ACOCQO_01835 [Halanaerobiaceae bacterium]
MGNCIDPIIFGNINVLIERFSNLTDAYRLHVGASEELTRTPSANQQVINDAITRTAFLGNILDQLLIAIQIAIILNFLDIEVPQDKIPNPFL